MLNVLRMTIDVKKNTHVTETLINGPSIFLVLPFSTISMCPLNKVGLAILASAETRNRPPPNDFRYFSESKSISKFWSKKNQN